MAKAITVVLLLAATAAIAAAHPGLGKGFLGSIMTSSNSSAAPAPDSNATAPSTVTLSHPHFLAGHSGNTDLSKCDCKDDCQETSRKVCKSRPKTNEVCKTEKGEEDVVECATKCFKADKLVSIGFGGHGKGRRLLSANSMQVAPHLAVAKAAVAHAVISGSGSSNATADGGDKQEICREICKPGKKPTSKKVCKKETKKEFYDCKKEVTSRYCVKNCKCGEKTITVRHTPDVGAIAAAVLHHGSAAPKQALVEVAAAAAAATATATANSLPLT